MRQSLVRPHNESDFAILASESSEKSFTYGHLISEIETTAQLIAPRSLIFIIGKNDIVCLLYYFAALKANAVPLLINASYSAQSAKLINLYSPHYVLCDKPTLTTYPTKILTQHQPYFLHINESTQIPSLHPSLAALATTSGSTGDPKLVRLSSQNLLSNAEAISQYLQLTPDDCAVAHLPISYAYGLSVINSHFVAGSSVLLSNKTFFDQSFWQDCRKASITQLAAVPFHCDMLLRLNLANLNLPSLKNITQAGGHLDPAKAKRLYDQCQRLGIDFWIMYGQTEASPRMSYLAPEDCLQHVGSIGRPIPGGKFSIHNEYNEDITLSQQVGELVYQGANVCLGYAHCVADLALADQLKGVLHTGDLARCDAEGFFYLEGRKNRFLKLYGNRISLDHLEKKLASLGYNGIASGQDDQLKIAIEYQNQGDTQALLRQLTTTLGIHRKAISIKSLPSIPHLPSGKVDYSCLN